MFNDYVESTRGLGIKPGLERIRACLNYLGNPQKKYKSVLITGTNGKGSVTFFLSNLACKFTNYKISRYISPHLVSWNERFVVNEKQVEIDFLEKFSYEVLKKIEDFENKTNLEKLTVFEVYTIVAFCLFEKENIDIAFLEIGMGGRLDATNVVDSEDVLCSVITSVSFDHMHHLGDSLEKIAYEKAGIIKRNNDVVTAVSGISLELVKKEVEKLNSQLVSLDFTNELYSEKNIETALATWNVISKKIKTKESSGKKEFLKSLQFPGRFHFFKEYNLLLDGAHNPAGAEELRKMLDKHYLNKKIIYILGMLNKDFKGFIKNLIPQNSNVICVEPKSERATSAKCLSDNLLEYNCKTFICKDLKEAIDKARTSEHDLILITGSLYLVGEALGLISKKQIKELICLPKHH